MCRLQKRVLWGPCFQSLLGQGRKRVIESSFPDSSIGKESTCNAGDPGLIPGSGRSPGEGIGYSFQYSWGSWWLSWERICLQCGRPGFDSWVEKIPWRREILPTPVFWPWEFHGLYSLWGCKESDTTERLSLFRVYWCFLFIKLPTGHLSPFSKFKMFLFCYFSC